MAIGGSFLKRAWAFGVPCLTLVFAALATPNQPATLDFNHDVLPVFKARCSPCHTGEQKAGGLSLSTYESAKAGGNSGPAWVPGKPATSLILKRIRGEGGEARMPMGLAPLGERDAAILAGWIDQGAKPPTGTSKQHWAYLPPRRPQLPEARNAGWVRNAIDAFVLERLEREGLRPSPTADRVTLIRRLTLDLTGLPPTPAEVDAFVSDRSPNAYERVVDRLLANPHYGERMSLPWLDAARYADSNGFQQDGDTFQYVWRDWVVRALNENMSFDRFTIEQLAGDLLPDPTLDQLVATGFNRNHMLNGEGGAIPEEQRNVILFDRVETTSTTWLGLTMTCARCHDHKYDPFTQKDYYSMMAFFNNVPESGVPSGGGQYRIADPWIYAGTPAEMARLKTLEHDLPQARAAAKAYEEGAAVDEIQIQWEQGATGLLAGSKAEEERVILAILNTAPSARDKAAAERLRKYFLDHGLPEPGASLRKRWKEIESELNRLRDSLPRVMVMSDKQPRRTHIFHRGNYEEPLDEVSPDVPAPVSGQGLTAFSTRQTRLDLARWIVSPQNPLTARVQVNRAWQTFFGAGLVRTEENFGVRGEPPTHPELLDWLAVDFRESGWNVKRLHKLIVMSNTYKQSSKSSKELLARDPENRLLARGARFRLPSMLLRDVALASSGLLDPKVGGKPVYPYQPKGIWDGLAITLERDFTYPQSKGSDNHRRSLYTFWRRTVAPGNMFDASTRQVCMVKSYRTSTPLHSLTMLNDITWVEAGRALAARVFREKSPESRLREAFRRVCARRPDSEELAILKRALDRSFAYFRENPAEAKTLLNEGDSKAGRDLDPVELAAYATVCQAIFNLDEAMTRE